MYIQKKYNFPRIPYSSEFLRKFFREYFNILLSFGGEGLEQAVMLCNQFLDRTDGSSNSTELNNNNQQSNSLPAAQCTHTFNLVMYQQMDPQINPQQQPPLFTRPMINMYEYSAGDPNKQPAAFANNFPGSFDTSSNYYQPRIPPYGNNSYGEGCCAPNWLLIHFSRQTNVFLRQ